MKYMKFITRVVIIEQLVKNPAKVVETSTVFKKLLISVLKTGKLDSANTHLCSHLFLWLWYVYEDGGVKPVLQEWKKINHKNINVQEFHSTVRLTRLKGRLETAPGNTLANNKIIMCIYYRIYVMIITNPQTMTYVLLDWESCHSRIWTRISTTRRTLLWLNDRPTSSGSAVYAGHKE